MVFSTNPNFQYEVEEEEEQELLPKNQQKLRVKIDRKNRGGKAVTLVTGFVGPEDDLKALGKVLKGKLGVGGSAKDGEIIVQGEFKERVVEILQKEGYRDVK